MLSLVGFLLPLFASSKKPKFKPDVEFDDLASGLNIDLFNHLSDIYRLDLKEDKRKKEEMTALLNR